MIIDRLSLLLGKNITVHHDPRKVRTGTIVPLNLTSNKTQIVLGTFKESSNLPATTIHLGNLFGC